MEHLCLGCMEPKGNNDVCPRCGYNDNAEYLESYIIPGTTIANHYLIGKLLDYNGESATYIAYDTELTCKVLIREFMPFSLCKRVTKSPTIS
ncbi:MAG: serine/threonine protein kinase, partial [Oscillospiraceae bacterium]|nr:serine/threonine protein kinase [Oscillospiraceae bacterium]